MLLGSIVLVNRRPIERVFLSDIQNAMYYPAMYLILTIIIVPIVFFVSFLMWLIEGEPTIPLQLLLLPLAIGAICSYIICMMIAIFRELFRPSYHYYIHHEKHGKLYLIKSHDKEKMLLSNRSSITNNKGDFELLETRQNLLSRKIYRETERKNCKLRDWIGIIIMWKK